MSGNGAGPATPAASPRTPLRIVVVDADDRTRESLAGILAIREGFRVVGAAGGPGEAVDLVERLRPDAVLLDLRLPDVDAGLAFLRSLRSRAVGPDGPRILAFGGTPELEVASLSAGAHAFTRKTFRSAELAAALGRCLADPGAGAPDPPLAGPRSPAGPGPAL